MNTIAFAHAPETSLDEGVDAFIACSGYEERASHAAALHSANARTRIALAFAEQKNHASRKKNDRRLRKMGFEFVPAFGDAPDIPQQVLRQAIDSASTEVPKLVIDFSSMTRVWLAAIVEYLATVERPVEVLFSYSPSKFSPPKHDDLNPVHVGPILPGHGPLQHPSAPISLVLGVGYGQDEALGVVELLDPRETFAFVTHAPLDRRFKPRIERANEELFSRVGHERVIPYSLTDWDSLAFTLDSLCSRLQFETRTVIVSLGPKPFSLISLLLAQVRKEIGIWRVSTGPSAPAHPRPPLGPCIVGRTRFTPTVTPLRR